jgi:hypothetical protein
MGTRSSFRFRNQQFFARSRKSRDCAEAYRLYAAQGIPQIDTGIAEKGYFWMETRLATLGLKTTGGWRKCTVACGEKMLDRFNDILFHPVSSDQHPVPACYWHKNLVSFRSVGIDPLSFTASLVPAMAIFLKGLSIGLRAGG